MNMRLRDANLSGQTALRQLTVVKTVPDPGEQLRLRVLVIQVGFSWYFSVK